MASHPEVDIERSSERLLRALTILLIGFASGGVALTFLGPALAPVHQAPAAARVGIVLLTVGLAALVWERHRSNRRLARSLHNQRILNAAFRNRLDVLEALLDAGDRLNAPVILDDALRIVLDAALDLTGAESGTASAFSSSEGVIKVERSILPISVDARPEDVVAIPLVKGDQKIGRIELRLPPSSRVSDVDGFVLLEQFADHASRVVARATEASKDRASIAYLQAANELKSRFLSTVSHELRTPLTSVLGYASTLDNHWSRLPEETRREFVRSIEAQGQRLARVVERILEAARVEFHGITVHQVMHDVRRSMDRALRSFPAAELERVQLAMPDVTCDAEVDPLVLEHSVGNLVDNALRYTNGPVRVSLDAYKSTIAVTVSDRGPGIDPEQLQAVLEPLSRLDEVASGTGLGLHVVRSLVGDHGGRLEIESNAEGTRVTVTLPRWGGQVPPRAVEGSVASQPSPTS